MEEKKNALMAPLSTDLEAMPDFEGGGPTGSEGFDESCLKLPFMKLAQASSDQVKKGSASYMNGLEAGMFFSPTFKKIYGPNVSVVVVKFYRSFAVYDGKGTKAKFLGQMTAAQFRKEVEPNAVRERSYFLDQKGHRYVDTRNFIVVPYDHPEDGPMILSLSSTATSASRDWCTMLDSIRVKRSDGKVEQAPFWTTAWMLGAVYTTYDEGDAFQFKTPDKLGWVRKGTEAEYFKLCFEQAQSYDTSRFVPDDVPAATEPVPESAKATIQKLANTGLVAEEAIF
jgi:hypothetical protein